MNQVTSRVGTQPKLSVTNEEIIEKYPQLVTIPQGGTHGVTFVGAIGDPSEGRDGNQYIPVKIYQMRNDIAQSQRSEANKFFRKWDALENLVGHVENMQPENFQEMGVKLGMVVEGAQLFVDYQLKPFYEGQDAVLNPRTKNFLAVNGDQLVYRNTRVQWDENLAHTGIEIRSAAEEITPQQAQALSEIASSGENIVVQFD